MWHIKKCYNAEKLWSRKDSLCGSCALLCVEAAALKCQEKRFSWGGGTGEALQLLVVAFPVYKSSWKIYYKSRLVASAWLATLTSAQNKFEFKNIFSHMWSGIWKSFFPFYFELLFSSSPTINNNKRKSGTKCKKMWNTRTLKSPFPTKALKPVFAAVLPARKAERIKR